MGPNTKAKLRGYGYLGITVALYLVAPFVTKEMYDNEAMHYNKPFFIAYFSSSLYTLYSLPLLLSHCVACRARTAVSKVEEGKTTKGWVKKSEEIRTVSTVSLAVILGSLNVLHAYLFNVGVAKTSVVSTVIIHDTSGAFVFLFCLLLLNWDFSWLRCTSVLVSLLGVGLIGIADISASHSDSALIGDLVSVASTVIYALFLTLMKKYIPNEDAINWNLYFSLTGIISTVLWFPALVFLHVSSFEPFELPNQPAFLCLLAEGVLGYVLPDYTLSLSTVVLDPLIVDIAQGIIGPLSMVFDYVYEGKTYNSLYLTGYSLTVLSFIVIIVHNLWTETPRQLEVAAKCIPLKQKEIVLTVE